MDIVIAPDPGLRQKTKPVKKITPDLLKLARGMIRYTQTFTDPEGVGLSANQIGRDERLFVAKLFKKFSVFINPKILTFSKNTKTYFEACLSVPDYYGDVRRPLSITVEYQDETGKTFKKRLRGIASWIFQHEMDHLNGILFVDRVLEQKGRMYKLAGKDQAGNDLFEEVRLI